jgi:hypothetical protein
MKGTTIAPGVRRDAYGIQARAEWRGTTKYARFAVDANLADIQAWQRRARKTLQASGAPDGWCYVYIVQIGNNVKIGRTVDVAQRLRGLQTSSPATVTLLVAVLAHASLEPAIHARFKHLRHSGEWFTLNDELLGFVELLRQNINPVALLFRETVAQATADAIQRAQ